MKTFNASQKSRIPILLFILSFTTFPGALHLSAQTTGNYTLNNYAHRSTNSNWETRFYSMTISVSSWRNYCTLLVGYYESCEAGIRKVSILGRFADIHIL